VAGRLQPGVSEGEKGDDAGGQPTIPGCPGVAWALPTGVLDDHGALHGAKLREQLLQVRTVDLEQNPALAS